MYYSKFSKVLWVWMWHSFTYLCIETGSRELPDWLWTPSVAVDDLELLILLSPIAKCWAFRTVLSHQVCVDMGIKLSLSCIQGEHSTHWTVPQDWRQQFSEYACLEMCICCCPWDFSLLSKDFCVLFECRVRGVRHPFAFSRSWSQNNMSSKFGSHA